MKVARLKLPEWALLRIAERDGWTCCICHQPYLPNERWEVHHDTPVAKGGTNDMSNLRLAHRSCNNELSDA